MKIQTIILICWLFALALCTQPDALAYKATSTYIYTLSPSFTETNTSGLIRRSPTNKPTKTLIPIPTHYPTFEVQFATTYTPSMPAICPPDKPNFTFSPPLSRNTLDPTSIDIIVQHALDNGASFQQIANAFENAFGFNDVVQLVDLTGDNVPELMIQQIPDIIVFACDNARFRMILDYSTSDNGIWYVPIVLSTEDMNLNGIPDIVVTYNFSTGSNTVVDILEWDGDKFNQLLQANHGEDSPDTSRLARALFWYSKDWLSSETGNTLAMEGGSDIEIRDIDHNGTKELILTDNGPSHRDTLLNFGPWRGKQVVFTWDGMHYLYTSLEMQPADFRFQAIQDADRQFLLGNYDISSALYNDVIFNDKLDWWSPEKMQYLAEVFYTSQYGEPTPMPLLEDKTEYLQLSAYAHFRLLLQYLTIGQTNSAKNWYDKLVSNFSTANSGNQWAQIGSLFWENYQKTKNLEASCDLVVEHVQANPEVLAPIGDSHHGFQSHKYDPQDVCPANFTFKH